MSGSPTVSVAICLLNSSRFIDETLASVFAQTYEDYEVILVDDGSTDGCAEAISRRYDDRRLTIIRQSHQGLSMARRASIAAASGEFIAFLDHDDVWRQDKLERQVAAARAHRSAALLFSDCVYVDEHGQPLRRLSEQYGLDGIDLDGTRAYAELLRRGCFVWQSTVLARKSALVAVDAFNPAYPYIADYDTWLHMARRYPLHYTPEVLAHWRVHATQFTNRCPEITLADHRNLLGPLCQIASTPKPIRIAMGDRLLGQHRVSCRALLRQRRYRLAVRAALGMFSYPDRLLAYCLGSIAEMPIVGRRIIGVYKTLRRAIRAPGKVRRTVHEVFSASPSWTHIWIDGTVLGMPQTGYFNLVSELVRTVAARRSHVVHVVTSDAGRSALRSRLGPDAESLRFHPERSRARRPRGRPPDPNTIEVVIWRGGFQWAGSRHIAIIQDLTTRIHPELHTAANVAEFDRYLEYVQCYAEEIVTVSEHSRRDIIAQLPVFPDSVSVVPMPLNPFYANPSLTREFVARHGISEPYVLCVGCIEPRKNLRRLVQAFELLADEEAARSHTLVVVGPRGWDEGFADFIAQRKVRHRIVMPGFVPVEHLPSLYRFAAAVVCPSVYEGFGLPVLEAMSCSAVVLASAVSSLPEVLGAAGLTFDPYRPEAIAEAMRNAITMLPADAESHRRRCRNRAETLMGRFASTPPLPGLIAR